MITVKQLVLVNPNISFPIDLSEGIEIELLNWEKKERQSVVRKLMIPPGRWIDPDHKEQNGSKTYLPDKRLKSVVSEILRQRLGFKSIQVRADDKGVACWSPLLMKM